MKIYIKVLAAGVAVLATSSAFACSGFIANMVGNCGLDQISDGIQQVIPGANVILNPGSVLPRLPQIPMPGPFPNQIPVQFPGGMMGGACLTPSGLHPMNGMSPVGSFCSGTNQFGFFETGSVVR